MKHNTSTTQYTIYNSNNKHVNQELSTSFCFNAALGNSSECRWCWHWHCPICSRPSALPSQRFGEGQPHSSSGPSSVGMERCQVQRRGLEQHWETLSEQENGGQDEGWEIWNWIPVCSPHYRYTQCKGMTMCLLHRTLCKCHMLLNGFI